MDSSIASILLLDGATNGAIYALLALAIVLIFAVTRIIFIPQGEFVAYGALTLALLQLGKVPGTVWLMLYMTLVAECIDRFKAARMRSDRNTGIGAWLLELLPALLIALVLTIDIVLSVIGLIVGFDLSPLAGALALIRGLRSPEGLVIMALAAASFDAAVSYARGDRRFIAVLSSASRWLVPLLLTALTMWAAPQKFPLWAQSLLTLAIVTMLGPLVYRLAYQRLAGATVLVLLIVSVGVHFALTGLGLVFFGAEGFRNPSFWDERFTAGALALSGQTIIIFAASLVLIVGLFVFFELTLRGKALRATAVNRLGARLMGISTTGAGKLSFSFAAFIGALSGLLIGPTTTIFYDSGFLIGLKGFVAAIFGGLASYPAAALGALFVGVLESFSSFYASAFKEVIVFTLIIPVLLWRSFQHGQHDEEEDE